MNIREEFFVTKLLPCYLFLILIDKVIIGK